MGLLDDVLRPVAKTVVDLFRSEAVTVRRTPATYTFATGVEVPGTPVDHAMVASPPFPFETSEIDGVSVLEGDAKVIVPALNLPAGFGAFDPATDVVFFPNASSVGWRIRGIMELWSGDQVAAYQLHLRK